MSPSPLTRDGAADDARRELSKDIYQQDRDGAAQRVWDTVVDTVSQVIQAIGHLLEGVLGWVVGVLVLAAVISAAVVLIRRRRAEDDSSDAADKTTDEEELTADEQAGADDAPGRDRPGAADRPSAGTADDLDELADRFAASGRHAEAIRQRLRAAVRRLADAGLIAERPARTAAEITTSVTGSAPAVGGPMSGLTEVFSEVWYGGAAATAGSDGQAKQLAGQITALVDPAAGGRQ